MGFSYDDYSDGEGKKVGLERKLGSKNAKLLLECTKKKLQKKQVKKSRLQT
jgi:hypothetical protein